MPKPSRRTRPRRDEYLRHLKSYLSHHVAEDQSRDAPESKALWLLENLTVLGVVRG